MEAMSKEDELNDHFLENDEFCIHGLEKKLTLTVNNFTVFIDISPGGLNC